MDSLKKGADGLQQTAATNPVTPGMKHFDRVAETYDDRLKTVLSAQIYAKVEAERLVSFTQAKAGMQILDVCSGTGRNSLALAATGATVVGLDHAVNMIRVAIEKARSRNISNVSFVEGDVQKLPFADNSFDAVIGTRFMYLMDREQKRVVISELQRVAKPGAPVVLQFNGCLSGIKHEILESLRGRKFRLRQRYLWPGQASRFFAGLRVTHVVGIALPFVSVLVRVLGERLALRLNRIVRIPPFSYLSYGMLVRAEKLVRAEELSEPLRVE
jgi:ubiquinone/menaquinone biosynthesis C-methylase UbiE